MAELKTKPTTNSVAKFLAAIPDADRRSDCQAIADMMAKVTKKEPKMWGSSIVGFDDYHYVGASGREGDWFIVGFSPRKQSLTLYLAQGFERHDRLLQALGKHKLGKGCLYINKLEDVNLAALRELIEKAVQQQAGTDA